MLAGGLGWSHSRTGCGARLAELCGLEVDAYLRAFERVNLIRRWPGKAGKGDAFDLAKARVGAIDLLVSGGAVNANMVIDIQGTLSSLPAELVRT